MLGHEIGHVARKHTVNAIQKNKAVATGVDQTRPAAAASCSQRMANQAYEMVLENNFDRGDELDADRVGVQLAQKRRLRRGARRVPDATRRAQQEPGGTQRPVRVAPGDQGAHHQDSAAGRRREDHRARREARYKATVKYEPTDITSIAVVTEGSAGLAGSRRRPTKERREERRAQEERLRPVRAQADGAQEKQSTQVSASGGARGLGADRAAKGGSNPSLVKVTVSGVGSRRVQEGHRVAD